MQKKGNPNTNNQPKQTQEFAQVRRFESHNSIEHQVVLVIEKLTPLVFGLKDHLKTTKHQYLHPIKDTSRALIYYLVGILQMILN